MTKNATTPPEPDLAAERRWGWLILASHDLLQVIKLIGRIPADSTGLDFAFETIGIVAAYGRPFVKNEEYVRVGDEFLAALTPTERTLHKRLMTLRNKDVAHSDFYGGRITCQIHHRRGSLDSEETGVVFYHGLQTRTRFLERHELPKVLDLATKLRDAIKARGREIEAPILAARYKVGHGPQEFDLASPAPARPIKSV